MKLGIARFVMRPRLFFVGPLLLVAALAIVGSSVASNPTTPVTRYETAVAGANFEFVRDGQSLLFQVAAVRDSSTTSPSGSTSVSTRVYVYFQQVDPETGEVYSWTCDTPVDDGAFTEMGWTAELHAVLSCGVTVDLVVEGVGAVNNVHFNWAHSGYSERLGHASATITANGVTYDLVSDQANITRYFTVDPLRTDRVLLVGESSGFYREDVDGLGCVGITDIYSVREIVSTNVFAAVTLDGSGTYHLSASGTVGYSIYSADGTYYQGTAAVRFRESVDLVLDESGSAMIPIHPIPIVLTSPSGAEVAFVLDGAIGVGGGNHIAFGLSGARCA